MRFLRNVFGALVALVILFEEWGWEPLQAALARLGRLPPLAWLERRIARLPSYAALALLAVPALAILPIKLAAVWVITRGHALAGLLIIVAAKLVGTAVLARLFALTRPALMKIAWFARGYAYWTAWKNELLAWVRASALWRAAAAVRQQVVAAFRRRR
jgi:hypothetical protein